MGTLRTNIGDWTVYVFDAKNFELVARQATLEKECLKETHALAKRKGETLPWSKCLPKGIRESKRLAAYLKRWEKRGNKEGGFMVECEDEDDVSTDDEE
jgi:hypothetical protein